MLLVQRNYADYLSHWRNTSGLYSPLAVAPVSGAQAAQLDARARLADSFLERLDEIMPPPGSAGPADDALLRGRQRR